MPKRKNKDEYEKLLKKFRKLEKKVRRRCRSNSRSSSTSRTSHNRYRSESREQEVTSDSENRAVIENNVANLLDESISLEPEGCAGPEPTPSSSRTPAPATEPAAAAETATATSAAAEPSTSAILTEILPQTSSSENALSADATLDTAILEILGEDPTVTNIYGAEVHKDLAVRLEHIATNGLSKEMRKELTEKYLLPDNCKLINGPTLNAEIKAAISDINAKRDKSIELRQKQVATAISCLSQAINNLFSCKDADPELIRMLMDAERILCDSQHNDSTIRRNFILSSLKKEMKDQLQNTKPDNLLFGQNLSETLKTAKAIHKSGAELKVPAPKPQATFNKKLPATNTSKNLNWKGPYPTRKPPNHPKRKEPPQNKSRQSSSSRRSHQQQTRDRR